MVNSRCMFYFIEHALYRMNAVMLYWKEHSCTPHYDSVLMTILCVHYMINRYINISRQKCCNNGHIVTKRSVGGFTRQTSIVEVKSTNTGICVLMLAKRRRRRANIKTAFGQHLLFAVASSAMSFSVMFLKTHCVENVMRVWLTVILTWNLGPAPGQLSHVGPLLGRRWANWQGTQSVSGRCPWRVHQDQCQQKVHFSQLFT